MAGTEPESAPAPEPEEPPPPQPGRSRSRNRSGRADRHVRDGRFGGHRKGSQGGTPTSIAAEAIRTQLPAAWRHVRCS